MTESTGNTGGITRITYNQKVEPYETLMEVRDGDTIREFITDDPERIYAVIGGENIQSSHTTEESAEIAKQTFKQSIETLLTFGLPNADEEAEARALLDSARILIAQPVVK